MYQVMKYSQGELQTWTDILVWPKRWKRDKRFGTWNVRSLYRVGSLTAATRELARYKLDLGGVQEVRWGNGSMVRAEDFNISMEKEMKIINWEQNFLYTTEHYQLLRP